MSSWDDIRYARHSVQAEVIGPSRLVYAVIVLVIAFFVVAFVWAKFAVIDEVTRGEGRVIPSSKVQIIQNLEGGIIKDVLAATGDLVDPGQVLMRIENVSSGSDLGELKARRIRLIGRIARLKAEIDDEALKLPADYVAAYGSIAQAQQDLLQTRRDNLDIQISILERQVTQREQEIRELEQKIDQAARSLALVREEIGINAPLVRSGVVPRTELLRLQREANDLDGEINASKLALPRAEAALREASERVEEKYLTFRTEAQTEMAEARVDLDSIDERMSAAQDRVSRTEIRSPVRGLIKTIYFQTIGG